MCPLYGVVGCPLFTGYLSIEVNGRTVGNVSLVVMYVGYSHLLCAWYPRY